MAKNPGKAQLAVWLPIDTMNRLKVMVQAEQSTLAAIIDRAINAYSPAPTSTPPDLEAITRQLADHAERLTRLESSRQLDADVDAVIAELAADGMKHQAIATELNQRGYTTANGKPYERGHSKIINAVKLVPTRPQLDFVESSR